MHRASLFTRSLTCTAGIALALALAGASLRAETEFSLTKGKSVQQLHGLTCGVYVPESALSAKERGLVFALHAYSADAQKFAQTVAMMARHDYVVVAPQWETEQKHQDQVEVFHRLVRDLQERLGVADTRLHCLIDADGYETLQRLAFSKSPRFRTATYTRGFFRGGKVPKHVRDHLAILSVHGEGHRDVKVARRAVGSLIGKVRAVEARVVAGETDKLPISFMKTFYGPWLRMQEGAYEPGDTVAFDWQDGDTSFTYWWSAQDGDDGRAVQTQVLHDPLVQHYGQQLTAGIAQREKAAAAFASTGAKTTPAVVVRDRKGKVKSVLEGAFKAKELAAALRKVAPEKKKPW